MLPAIRNVPSTPDQWKRWAWDHRDSHNRIRTAIKTQYKIDLTDFQIEPINPEDFQNFLQNNSQLHDDMNGVLGLQSTNLQDADLTKENQLQSWFELHYFEHYYAEAKLGI